MPRVVLPSQHLLPAHDSEFLGLQGGFARRRCPPLTHRGCRDFLQHGPGKKDNFKENVPTWEERAIAGALGVWDSLEMRSKVCNRVATCDDCAAEALHQSTNGGKWIRGLREATLAWARTQGGDEEVQYELTVLESLYEDGHFADKQYDFRSDELRARFIKSQLRIIEDRGNRYRQHREEEKNGKRKSDKRPSLMADVEAAGRNALKTQGPISPPIPCCQDTMEEFVVREWHKHLEAFGLAGDRRHPHSPIILPVSLNSIPMSPQECSSLLGDGTIPW